MKIKQKITNIPTGGVITKIKGHKKYRVVRTLEIYGRNRQSIEPPRDCVFLMPVGDDHPSAGICTQEKNLEVYWYCDKAEAVDDLVKLLRLIKSAIRSEDLSDCPDEELFPYIDKAVELAQAIT